MQVQGHLKPAGIYAMLSATTTVDVAATIGVPRAMLPFRRSMLDASSSSGRTWRYRFSRRGGDEVETGEFTGDDAAIARARELSTSMEEAVVVERFGLVDWHYVDEVDERP